MKRRRGVSLLEMLFVISLITLLVGTMMFLYVIVLRGWDQYGKRTDLAEKLNFTLERMLRDVRKAKAITPPAPMNSHSIRFTLCEGSPTCTDNSYIYYLYHASNTWPPAFNQTSYELRRAPLSGGINGTFTYGAGDLIALGIKPPPETDISYSGTVVEIKKLAASDASETITVSGAVRPRNV